jgi:predicted TIM-barrel fold metal-dependent hydrolase
VRALADRFGASRLLWGSDVGQSPAPYAQKIARLQASATLLDPQERACLLGGTALRLYGASLT